MLVLKKTVWWQTDSIQSYQEPLQGVNIFLMFEIFLVYPVGIKSFTVWYSKPNFWYPWISGYCKFQTLSDTAKVHRQITEHKNLI